MEYKYLKWATEVRQGLNAAAMAGTLTVEMLTEALYTIEDGGPGWIPGSIGAGWIFEHPAEFARVVGDVRAFLEANADVGYDFIACALKSVAILESIAVPTERDEFIRRAFKKYGDISQRWVKAMFTLGYSREYVADLIVARLHAITPEALKCVNALYDFLRFGREDREGSKNAPWKVLGNRLMEALRICAEKSPEDVLRESFPLEDWLPPAEVKELCVAAADRLDTLRIPYCALTALPEGTALALVRRTQKVDWDNAAAMKFLLTMSLEHGDGFFAEMGRLFDQLSPTMLYHEAVKLESEWAHATEAVELVRKVKQRLVDVGYAFGKVELGEFFDRRSGRKRAQRQVTLDDVTYVQDRNAHRYYPQLGDEVIFKKSGRALTPRVTAVIFVPVDPKKERD